MGRAKESRKWFIAEEKGRVGQLGAIQKHCRDPLGTWITLNIRSSFVGPYESLCSCVVRKVRQQVKKQLECDVEGDTSVK